MDHSAQLESLIRQFNREALTAFYRSACGSFRPGAEDLSPLLNDQEGFRDLVQLGAADLSEGRRIIFLAGETAEELTSRSGKLKQYEIARRTLKAGFYDAGIFVFHDPAGSFRFSLITAQYTGEKREFSSFRRYTYFLSPDAPAHTFLRQIGTADFSSVPSVVEAFSVEPVTKEFFKEYRKIFEDAEKSIEKEWGAEKKRLYTQRFFNRMMFLAFLERKGWMRLHPDVKSRKYLRELFEEYIKNKPANPEVNFHRSRLNTLFFVGLNYPSGDRLKKDPEYAEFRRIIGDVPFLNGGLFEKEPDEIDGPLFADSIIERILDNLVYHYNFTVMESTPSDVEVAVDPEMLGRIFEELVTGRHESGSYYTPKPIVAFMCKEALKVHLQTELPGESETALESFLERYDPDDLRNSEAALGALRRAKVCDPACGSGAYLLGMMHELLELRQCLFAARAPDKQQVYDRKLEIIQNNLYGVDIDPFAVNIARLRLWLSLIVDYDAETPPPLPNLDFKIEAGDSLTAPDPSGGMAPDLMRDYQIKEFLRLKNEYMSLHATAEKKKQIEEQIESLRKTIREYAHPGAKPGDPDSFDWQVEFAEVFAPALAQNTLAGRMAGVVNETGGQMELTAAPGEGGFDIILANPPYIRQEQLKEYKQKLKPVYPEVYTGTADLYVYFFARAHQLLKNGGAACFISSNKWLRAGYGEKLREHLLDAQAFRLVVDFGELPVFQKAATFPAIFLWQKADRGNSSTKWAVVKDLSRCYEDGISNHINSLAEIVPADRFGKDQPRLASDKSAEIRKKMEASGQRLGEYVNHQIYYGIKTGLNEAFVIDQETRDRLIADDKKSAEIIKPLLAGDDIRKYEIHFRQKYLIWTYIGVPIEKYPSVFKHLKRYKKDAMSRQDQGENWWELRSCNYYEIFTKPKIFYPEIAREPRWARDEIGYFPLKTVFTIPLDDYYLLGILNSITAWNYIKTICSVLGDENKGGRLTLQTIFLEQLPIPSRDTSNRNHITSATEKTNLLHNKRHIVVENFLNRISIGYSKSTNRNPLENPWLLNEDEYRHLAKGKPIEVFRRARDETMALTEEIGKMEAEIDARVAALYGL